MSLKELQEATGYLTEDVPDGFVGKGSDGGEWRDGKNYTEAGERKKLNNTQHFIISINNV